MKWNNERNFVLEICVDSLSSLHAAIRGGADRIELCSNLKSGGLTPSHALIQLAVENSTLPINVLIRPRVGDFCYDEHEIQVIKREIELIKHAGAAGVVCGFLLSDGSIDEAMTKCMVEIAKPLSFTFHRAFDLCNNPYSGLESIIRAGCERLLTSGQENRAVDGLSMIKSLVEQADQRIIIMPGSGIDINNLESIISTGAKEFHMSASVRLRSRQLFFGNEVMLGIHPENEFEVIQTTFDKVSTIKSYLKDNRIIED